MFAAFSSFVPNILILGDKDKQEQPAETADDDADENDVPGDAMDHPAKPTVDTSSGTLAGIAEPNMATPRTRRTKQEKPLCEVRMPEFSSVPSSSPSSPDIHHRTTTPRKK